VTTRPAPKRRAGKPAPSAGSTPSTAKSSGTRRAPAPSANPRAGSRRAPSASRRPAGRRAAAAPARRTKARRFPALPTPAFIGALALVVAGVGAIAVSTSRSPEPFSSPYEALSSKVGSDRVEDPNSIDVSRDFDRDLLEKQAQQQAEQRDAALAELVKKTQQRAQELETEQWVLPVAGYRLTAGFGQTSSLWSTVHTGTDFAAPSGTAIVSVARGTVTEVGYEGAYGNRTVITLDDGTEIWYCHQTAATVSVGDVVDPGQSIGSVGATGNVTGPHLHLEVRPAGGDPVDPYAALVDHGVTP